MSDIAMTRTPIASPDSRMSWSAIVVGALAGSALSFVFVGFGVAVGLGVSSAAPTWRDASVALWVLSGLYLILQALISFAVAGYVAGWLSNSHGRRDDNVDASDTFDGLHGLAAWALAVLIGAFLAALIAGGAASRAAPNASAPRVSAAEPLLSYELDRLFRAPRRGANADLSAERAEAGRILLTASSHRGVVGDDRAYLVQLVSAAGAPDAERRVDAALENSKQAIARSRAGGIIAAFSVASALLLGAVAAWMAAGAGVRHRNGEPVPRWLRGSQLRQI